MESNGQAEVYQRFPTTTKHVTYMQNARASAVQAACKANNAEVQIPRCVAVVSSLNLFNSSNDKEVLAVIAML